MNAEQYKALTKPLRDNPKAASLVAAVNKSITTIYYVTYPLLVAFLIATQNALAWKAMVFPAVGFVLVSTLRRIINRPRPYEAFDCPSVIPKDTKGKSFPSRDGNEFLEIRKENLTVARKSYMLLNSIDIIACRSVTSI